MHDGFIKVAAVSPRLKVADCEYNIKVMQETIQASAEAGIMLVVFPELSITGCSCKDLFFQKKLQQAAKDALLSLAEQCPWQTAAIVGLPYENNGKLYDCAAVIYSGKILGIIPKTHISQPFGRWFAAAPEKNGKTAINGEEIPFGAKLIFQSRSMPELTFGCEIGDDIYLPFSAAEQLAAASATTNANIIINIIADAELAGRSEYRRTAVSAQSARLTAGLIMAGAGEGESTADCVYSGENFIAENGQILASSKPFGNYYCSAILDLQKLAAERRQQNSFPQTDKKDIDIVPFDLLLRETRLERPVPQQPFVPEKKDERRQRAEEILQIQAHALKKRINHTNAKRIILGISGGLDSALALLASVRALDSEGRPRKDILAYTMPCFGTTDRTKNNAEKLCEQLGVELRTIEIKKAVRQHFRDLGHDGKTQDTAYENSQARERTQLLMDAANMENGIVIGTGDMSELALGWATYNGDHMSMYSVNAGIPKTLVRALVEYEAEQTENEELRTILKDILRTPVSPELLPAKKGETQKTEELVGPYELHDFFLYWFLRFGFSPAKIARLAKHAFGGDYPESEILKWLRTFLRRFFSQQYKRSCQPDGAKTGTVSLSPRGDWAMPSDAAADLWLAEMDKIDEEYAQRAARKSTTYEQYKKNRRAKRMALYGKQQTAEKPRVSSMDMFLKQFGGE